MSISDTSDGSPRGGAHPLVPLERPLGAAGGGGVGAGGERGGVIGGERLEAGVDDDEGGLDEEAVDELVDLGFPPAAFGGAGGHRRARRGRGRVRSGGGVPGPGDEGGGDMDHGAERASDRGYAVGCDRCSGLRVRGGGIELEGGIPIRRAFAVHDDGSMIVDDDSRRGEHPSFIALQIRPVPPRISVS